MGNFQKYNEEFHIGANGYEIGRMTKEQEEENFQRLERQGAIWRGNMKDIDIDREAAYKLMEAITGQAARDMEAGITEGNEDCYTCMDCEKYFHSDLFSYAYPGIRPEYMVKKIREMAKKKK